MENVLSKPEYTLDFYEDMAIKRKMTFSTVAAAEKCAHSILDNVVEYFDTYCILWEGKKMLSYITSKNF